MMMAVVVITASIGSARGAARDAGTVMRACALPSFPGKAKQACSRMRNKQRLYICAARH
jgi:hypothetical protein